MRKKTSAIIGLIATILTAYISAATLSNQAFAQYIAHPTTLFYGLVGASSLGQTQTGQGTQVGNVLGGQEVNQKVTQANVKVLGQEAQLGKILTGHGGLGAKQGIEQFVYGDLISLSGQHAASPNLQLQLPVGIDLGQNTEGHGLASHFSSIK